MYEDMCVTTRLLKGVSARFKELDTDGSGVLEGEEIMQMAAWILRMNAPSITYEPTKAEVLQSRDNILLRFKKSGPDATVTMSELAVVYDEILVHWTIASF